MDVNAMHRPPTSSRATLVVAAAKAGAAAAIMAALLVGRLPEAVIIVGVIVVASMFGWRRTLLMPARMRSEHRFTVVSRCGDGVVTIDRAGVRRVSRAG